MNQKIKNIAIIAHVDHGKTTLLDKILDYCQSISGKESMDRVMDSNDLERERGITITSKNTAVTYKDYKINIIDTPGHSDFGGEVERVLKMADSCLLLVDAFEGPMSQTRFVLKKALELGQKIILVVNKIDKPNCTPDKVVDDSFDLFGELGASDEQSDFPIVYASAKENYAILELEDEPKDISPLLDVIIAQKDEPTGDIENPFLFQVTTLSYSEYIGRICIGRIYDGKITVGDFVYLLSKDEDGKSVKTKHKITKLFTFLGLQRIETNEAASGDIVAIAGLPDMTIGDTLCGDESIDEMERVEIEPPTVSMEFMINDSPLGGKEGKYLTTRNIAERLARELQTNVALQVTQKGESFEVRGRGELHLAILIETMRREGFELGVCKPQVIFKTDENEKRTEPFETITLDMPERFSGAIIQELNRRKGLMVHMENLSDDYVRLKFEIPTRGFIGFRSLFLTETRGLGSYSGLFLGYKSFAGEIGGRKRGAIVSMANGKTTTYSLYGIEERGSLFIGAGTDVYNGMVIGLHNKEQELEVNPVKGKKLTNVRASGSDESLRLTPPMQLTMESGLDFLEDDEILEVTPALLRLRKKILDPIMRKRSRFGTQGRTA